MGLMMMMLMLTMPLVRVALAEENNHGRSGLAGR
jgi:hypothetical protein